MPDPFGVLPLPLPLMVMKNFDNLPTIHNLLLASPAANIIFKGYYCQVVEAILINYKPFLQCIIRTIARIRSGHTTSEVLNKYSTDQDIIENLREFPALMNAYEILSNEYITVAATRSLIASSANIQQLNTLFFDTFLDRVNKIRPARRLGRIPHDKCYGFVANGTTSEDEYHYPRCKTPEGQSYTPNKCGKPSWVEQQRVYRALWRLQMYFDFRALKHSLAAQPVHPWIDFETEGPFCKWTKLREGQRDELLCVYEFLCDISIEGKVSLAQSVYLSRFPMVQSRHITTQESLPANDDEAALMWDQHPIEIYRRSPGARFFNFHSKVPTGPLYRSNFAPFRRFGLGIWDLEKMSRLGLLCPQVNESVARRHWVAPFQEMPEMPDISFRWYSLMNDDGKEHSEKDL